MVGQRGVSRNGERPCARRRAHPRHAAHAPTTVRLGPHAEAGQHPSVRARWDPPSRTDPSGPLPSCHAPCSHPPDGRTASRHWASAPLHVAAPGLCRTPCRARVTTWCPSHRLCASRPPIKRQEPRSRVTTRAPPPAPWLLSTPSSCARRFSLPSSLLGVSPGHCRRSCCCLLPRPVRLLAEATAPAAAAA
jgi:hypothetical protein